MDEYLHGFSPEEQERLYAQARFLEQKIFGGLNLAGVDHLLEVGCGVGAQTEILLRLYPRIRITGIDLIATQVERARQYLAIFPNLRDRCEFKQMDASQMTAPADSFDGAFFCWMLEHAPHPVRILQETHRVLRPGGQIFLTEVFNATFFMQPLLPAVESYWSAFNKYQQEIGGDPFVGARLGHHLRAAGFSQIETHSRTFHFDSRQPKERSDMIDYWCGVMFSAALNLIKAGKVSPELVSAARAEMAAAQQREDTIFYYSFIQATARKN